MLILLVASVLFGVSALRIVAEGERLVVLRLGRFFRVLAPGLHVVLPAIDRTVRVRLDADLRMWRELPEHELDAKLHELASTGQLPTDSSL